MDGDRKLVRVPVVERRSVVAARAPVVAVGRVGSVGASLQQRLGNRGTQTVAGHIVARFCEATAAPAKAARSGSLSISQPGDAHEREADSVADKVMRMTEAPSAPLASRGLPSAVIQRRCTTCEKEASESKVQRRESAGGAAHIAPSVSASINALKSGGQPLPVSTRAFFEPRFGTDFGQVRVHTDSHAAQAAKSISARAFTAGRDIAFGTGEFSPDSQSGRHLIAHELTHVIQQNASESQRTALPIAPCIGGAVISRFPSPVSFGIYEPGLAVMPPVIKEGYDGKTYTAIKNNWGLSSWERRWQIYDAEDKLLYEDYYTWPKPTQYIPKDVVAKGKAGGSKTPWSVWHEVTETEVPFGGSDPENFPYTYTTFYVYDTWNDFAADPNAKLSDARRIADSDNESGKSGPIDSPLATGTRSLVDYGSVVAMHEAYLREIYNTSIQGITDTARDLVAKGVPQGDVARWANDARNGLKQAIRSDGNAILQKVFEARNLNKYGNKLGPSYEWLYQKYARQGLSPEEINKKIIGNEANIKVNRWSGRLRIAGRIMLGIDIALAGVRVYLAPQREKTKVALEEVARIGGALAVGAVGAKGGAAVGAAVGALFGGAGAAPGAIIGGLIGAIGGAMIGGWLGKSAVKKLYEMFPPSDCVFEGDFTQEDQK
jgi:hypothetical protein